jgi:hypothetical protein
MEYKGYTIQLEPLKQYCSEYAITILDITGEVCKRVSIGGESQETAFEHGKKIVDFEIEYAKENE